MKKTAMSLVLVAAMGLTLSVATVQAVPTLDFGVAAPTTGTISFAGGVAPLVGAGISVDNVTGLDSPINNLMTAACVMCALNFTTGGFTGVNSSGDYLFGGGGTITIVGGVDLTGNGAVGDPGDIAKGTTLLTGTFDSAEVDPSGKFFKVVIAGFQDTKDPTLLRFFGLPGGTFNGSMNLSFNAAGTAPHAFNSKTVLSGDIVNTAPVPEPATLLLLGSGLLGLGVAGRKRLSRRSEREN